MKKRFPFASHDSRLGTRPIRNHRSCRWLLALVVIPSIFASAAVSAGQPPWDGSNILRDPEWQKSFLGSYGFLAGVEPEIKNSEIEILREVIDLMQVNPRAAAGMLERRTSADSSAALDFVLANLQFQNGFLPKARARYEAALEKFPDFRRAEKNLGLLLVQMNELETAIPHLARAIELGDRDGRTYGLLGYAHLSLENHVSAEAAYRQAILQQPAVGDWQLGLARALLAEERYREVVALFSTYLKREPTDANAWKVQANAFLGLDQPREAAVNLEAVRMLGKADPPTLMLIGDIYMKEGVTDLAKDAYLEVIESDDSASQYKAAYRAADLLLRASAVDDAATVIDSIARRYSKKLSNDEQLEFMTLRARLERARGNTPEAVALLEKIIRLDGTRGDAILELSRYYFDQKRDSEALLLLDRAENLEDYEYRALLEEASYRASARQYEKAAVLLRKALHIQREPRVERFLTRVEDAAKRQ